MSLLTVRHLTVYRYSEPVGLGEHRMMFRPRESHDLRLLKTKLRSHPLRRVCGGFTMCSTTPSPSRPSMARPPSCGSTALSRSSTSKRTLPDYPLEEYAKTYPFRYSDDEIPDLGQRAGPSLCRDEVRRGRGSFWTHRGPPAP